MDKLHKKYQKLQDYFKELGSVAIAFSGGVDSTFLLAVATETLPKEKVVALTMNSIFFPNRENLEALLFCQQRDIKQIILSIDILKVGGIAQNPNNRCYLCKYELFRNMQKTAKDLDISNVCEGSNTDDLGDYRPGLKAIAELGILSPLRIAELSKAEIRTLSQEMNLPTWNKPSFACLASRLVYGEQITTEKLKIIDQAEQYLLDLGFTQMRVRMHGKIARIEVLAEDMKKTLTFREKIHSYFTSLGFGYVTLDLKGYRTGSMNETILPKGQK